MDIFLVAFKDWAALVRHEDGLAVWHVIRLFQTLDNLTADDARVAGTRQLARAGRWDFVSVGVGHVVQQTTTFARDGADWCRRGSGEIIRCDGRFRLDGRSGRSGIGVLVLRCLSHRFGGRSYFGSVRRWRVRIRSIGADRRTGFSSRSSCGGGGNEFGFAKGSFGIRSFSRPAWG